MTFYRNVPVTSPYANYVTLNILKCLKNVARHAYSKDCTFILYLLRLKILEKNLNNFYLCLESYQSKNKTYIITFSVSYKKQLYILIKRVFIARLDKNKVCKCRSKTESVTHPECRY